MPAADLPPLIRALLRPDAYSHPVDSVELRQTHISYVLLAGEHVYKIKKPVNFGFLNFSTLSRRRYYCRQEVVLNSRLCSDVYLGVVPIRESGGRFAVGGPGAAVEYAVHMRRLPDERSSVLLLALRNAVLEIEHDAIGASRMCAVDESFDIDGNGQHRPPDRKFTR